MLQLGSQWPPSVVLGILAVAAVLWAGRIVVALLFLAIPWLRIEA